MILGSVAFIVGCIIIGAFADHCLCEIAKAIVIHADVLERTARKKKTVDTPSAGD